MQRIHRTARAFAVAATLVGGCAGSVQYSGEVQVSSPQLVEVQPGVQVMADADQPLFFSSGYYWLYSGGIWMRSDTYRGGFARVDINVVPMGIQSIRSPNTYVHYRQHASIAHATPAPVRVQPGREQPRVENRPVENRPVENRPVENRPVENRPEAKPEIRSTEPAAADHARPAEPTAKAPVQKPTDKKPVREQKATPAREQGAEHDHPDEH
jgi:hypothetical protein